MHYLWADRADDMEYELCQLIGCKSLQAYLASPTGFFDYHFKRYTKSRRKAPIYWLLASEDGTVLLGVLSKAQQEHLAAAYHPSA